MSEAMTSQALTGLRVIDLSDRVAGPFCTKLLAGYGAEVIKIETPMGGDLTRSWGPYSADEPHPERSGIFLYLNTGKKSVTLNIRTSTGIAIFKQLIRDADLFVENLAPGTLSGIGLSQGEIEALNPRLVHVAITSFGQDGPYSGFRSTELTMFGSGGQMALTGDREREPLKNFGHQAEYQAGLSAFGASLAFLFRAIGTGEGDSIDISIQEVQAEALEGRLPTACNKGLDAARWGNKLWASWGIYPCQDGFVGICAQDRNLANLYRAIGCPELVDDPRYRNLLFNPEANDEVEALLYEWCIEHTKQEIYDIAGKTRAPFAPIPTVAELVNWPALQAKGFWTVLDHPAAGELVYPGAPFVMGDSDYVLTRAPMLGEHNVEVYCGGLGYSRPELLKWKALGIV